MTQPQKGNVVQEAASAPTGPKAKPAQQQRARKPKGTVQPSSDGAQGAAANAAASSEGQTATSSSSAAPKDAPKAPKAAKKQRPKKDKGEQAGGADTTMTQEANKTKVKGAAAQAPSTASAVAAAPPEAETVAKKKRKKKSKKGSSNAAGNSSKADATPTVRLKVVVRRLPPNVPEEVFWKSVEQWVVRPQAEAALPVTTASTSTDQPTAGDEPSQAAAPAVPAPLGPAPTVDYARFVQGKLSSNPTGTKPSVHSRAYIKFLDVPSLVAFHKGYDGHLFRDSKGNESVAIVEYAPYQRTPVDAGVKKKKKDPRQGTIEDDPDFKDFLQKLELVKNAAGADGRSELSEAQLIANLSSLTLAESAQSDLRKEQARSTPLLEHLRAQRKAAAAQAAAQAASSKRKKGAGGESTAAMQKAAMARKMAAQQMELRVAGQKKKAEKGGEGDDAAANPAWGAIPTGPKSMTSTRAAPPTGPKGAGAGAPNATTPTSAEAAPAQKSKQQQQQQQQRPAASSKKGAQGGAEKGRAKGAGGKGEGGAAGGAANGGAASGGAGKSKKGKGGSGGGASGQAATAAAPSSDAGAAPTAPKPVAILKRAP